MSPFTPEQIGVLRQLTELWRGVDFSLIGAAALGCHQQDPSPSLQRWWRGA